MKKLERMPEMKAFAFVLAMMLMTITVHAGVAKQAFGKTPDGAAVDLYTLKDGKVEVAIMTYGGTVVSLKTPDKKGNIGDIALGYSSLDGYLAKSPYFGALIGRYGNRIAKGSFVLNGKKHQVPVNDGANSLHGGTRGFDKVVWRAKQIANGVELTYVSPDGDQGYPGKLTTTVRYTLQENSLKLEYSAETDQPTVLNLTNHTYFNLAGKGDILSHQVRIAASRYTPVDGGLIPTGELASVEGTPFDFRKSTAIGKRIGDANEQLKLGKGYDHNWVLDGTMGELKNVPEVAEVAEVAEVYDAESGRTLEVLTDQPGLQFYTGNFLDGTITGKGGQVYGFRSGLCLETQHYPDSPNHPAFPTTELKPGQHYHSVTTYRFGTR